MDAILHDDLGAVALIQAERVWGPYRGEAVRRRMASGALRTAQPEHWHWDWSRKAAKLSLLAYRGVGIECQGHVQGLALLRVAGSTARVGEDVGKPLVYLSYVETAPWNARELEESPKFGGIGTRLIEASIRVSSQEGFAGRLGLHSLPQSEGFYRDVCGMQDCGRDRGMQDLRYFELTRPGAKRFLEGAL